MLKFFRRHRKPKPDDNSTIRSEMAQIVFECDAGKIERKEAMVALRALVTRLRA